MMRTTVGSSQRLDPTGHSAAHPLVQRLRREDVLPDSSNCVIAANAVPRLQPVADPGSPSVARKDLDVPVVA